MSSWRVSHHAADRAAQMHVTVDEVLAVVERPVMTYPSSRRYPGCRVAVAGALAVPYEPDNGTIITVLWDTAHHGGQAWDRTLPAPQPTERDRPGPSGIQAAAVDRDPKTWRRTAGRQLDAADRRYIDDDRPLCLDCGRHHPTVADALACQPA